MNESTENFILSCGPFELLQTRQLIESNIAEFAAIQATKQDLVALMRIQEKRKVKIGPVILAGIKNFIFS
ncbi:hypothetical protein P4S72_29780 [Vibrio sp. PP-XX7]